MLNTKTGVMTRVLQKFNSSHLQTCISCLNIMPYNKTCAKTAEHRVLLESGKNYKTFACVKIYFRVLICQRIFFVTVNLERLWHKLNNILIKKITKIFIFNLLNSYYYIESYFIIEKSTIILKTYVLKKSLQAKSS